MVKIADIVRVSAILMLWIMDFCTPTMSGIYDAKECSIKSFLT